MPPLKYFCAHIFYSMSILMIMIRYPTDVFPDLYNYDPVLSPKKKKCKKAKWLSEEALQISEKRREAQGKGEKERYTHLNAEFQIIAGRDKKAFLCDQCKQIEENNRMGFLQENSRHQGNIS